MSLWVIVIWAGDGGDIPEWAADALRASADIRALADGTLEPGITPDGELTET